MSSDPSKTIESVLQEQRVFHPTDQSGNIASLQAYQQLADVAKSDPEIFWGDAARKELHWFRPFHRVLDWTNPPFARWFGGGPTNISYNCLDRHLATPQAEKDALVWEGEPGDVRRYTEQPGAQVAGVPARHGVSVG